MIQPRSGLSYIQATTSSLMQLSCLHLNHVEATLSVIHVKCLDVIAARDLQVHDGKTRNSRTGPSGVTRILLTFVLRCRFYSIYTYIA